MKTKTLQQKVRFRASPIEVYEMLMDSRKHRSLSSMPAKISKKVGGRFTAWGSHISGFNLALLPGRKIVQAWRATGCGRIITRSPSLTSRKYEVDHILSSRRSVFPRTAIAVITAAGSKPIGHQ